MEHFEDMRTQYRSGRAWGRKTLRPGYGGRLLDISVTGVGSPAQPLLELEVGLGLGERIEQQKMLCFASQ
jgi:hypothetical protein